MHRHCSVALFTGLDHDSLPALFLTCPVTKVFTIPGNKGKKGMDPQFGGLLYQEIHFFPFEQTLAQGQGCSRHAVLVMYFDNGRGYHFFFDRVQGCGVQSATSIKKFNELPRLKAKDNGNVPGLGAGYLDVLVAQSIRGKEKTSHGLYVAQSERDCTEHSFPEKDHSHSSTITSLIELSRSYKKWVPDSGYVILSP